MTVLAIGRSFDGFDVCPWIVEWRGDTLHLEGSVTLPAGTSAAIDKVRACRDRVLSLVDNRDETVVAVTYTTDPSVDGFYRPTSAQISEPLHIQSTLSCEFQMDLHRAGGGSLPQVEVYGMHAVRTNPHSISNTSLNGAGVDPIIGYPASAYDAWAGFTVMNGGTRVSATGNITIGDISTNLPVAMATTFSTPVADHYDGACEIRATYGSATSQLVGGRWGPSTWAGVTLSNGLIRVSKHASSDTGLFVEVYDGTQWEPLHASTTSWIVESENGGAEQNWLWGSAGMQILRNSPEACSVRLFTPEAKVRATYGRVWLDLTVQRGKRHIAGLIHSDAAGNSSSNKFALEPSTSIASTAITGGLRATSNDAQGNRAVWGAAGLGSITTNLTTGRVSQTSSGLTTMPWFVGVELTGSSATGLDTAQEVAYQWYDVASETQRVVRR